MNIYLALSTYLYSNTDVVLCEKVRVLHVDRGPHVVNSNLIRPSHIGL